MYVVTNVFNCRELDAVYALVFPQDKSTQL